MGFSQARNSGGKTTKAAIAAASSGDNAVVAAIAGTKIRVLDIVCIAQSAVSVRFEADAGGTALTGVMSLTDASGFAPGYNPDGHFETTASTTLNLELSAGVSVDGWLEYEEI